MTVLILSTFKNRETGGKPLVTLSFHHIFQFNKPFFPTKKKNHHFLLRIPNDLSLSLKSD
jgi:hypothetical protein